MNVTHILGYKSRLTLVHKFTNHPRLCEKLTRHMSILALIRREGENPSTFIVPGFAFQLACACEVLSWLVGVGLLLLIVHFTVVCLVAKPLNKE